jgi:hypothetical protein
MKEDEDEKHVRELNEAAERDAELSRVKAQLWQRIAAAMRDSPGVAAKGPSHLVVTAHSPSSSKP